MEMGQKLTEYNSPAVSSCSCCNLPAGNSTYVCEVIFTYCLQEQCVQCSLVNISERQGELETIKQAVEREVKYAVDNGYKKFCVYLIGGDSFSAWEQLISFSEWLWKAIWGIEVSLGLTLCSAKLSYDEKTWILRNKEQLSITFRYNGALGRTVWENNAILRHSVVKTACLCVTQNSLSLLEGEIRMFANEGKDIVLEYLDVETWSRTQMLEYVRSITRASLWYCKKYRSAFFLSHRFTCSGGKGRNLVVIDTDGKRYPCRYCSPERMIYSTLRERIEWFSTSKNSCGASDYIMKAHVNYAVIAQFHDELNRRVELLLKDDIKSNIEDYFLD